MKFWKWVTTQEPSGMLSDEVVAERLARALDLRKRRVILAHRMLFDAYGSGPVPADYDHLLVIPILEQMLERIEELERKVDGRDRGHDA